jgi:integrase
MPLRIVRRKSTGALTIVGTVSGQRIRRRASSDDLTLAREEAAALEAEILRTAWHGERRGVRTFDEALVSYLEAQPRSENTKARLRRLRVALGTARLGEVDQDTAVRLKAVLRPSAGAATYLREVVTPLRAILRHAAERGWCDAPNIKAPKTTEGRTLYILPDEAERLIGAAASHLRPLLIFLLGTGARLSEALELEWRDVDLAGARTILWRTKSGRRRNAALPPRVVAALTSMPHRDSMVFRRRDGRPYADHERRYGGQIKTAWKGILRRAELDPKLTPHDLRHTWASWHYATHKDLLRLRQEGGWSSVTLVERYAHLLPTGHEAAIQQFLGWHQAGTAVGAVFLPS